MLAPIAASLAFVSVASRAVPVPTSSLWLFLLWWGLISAAATGVLLLVDWSARRLLPLAALFKLSLVFPDVAPSRFETALKSDTVETLAERVRLARERGLESTPVEAAQQLLGLVASLDRHDKLTRGHCERVRAYSQIIARQLRLRESDRDLLNWAALLHDVGKLGVPTEVLSKPGKPTDEEWELIKRHPEIGEELVAPLREWLGEWSRAIGDHHERWDGKGYPRGLAGNEITLGGRIVAVADVFDVITSARSYKSASSTARARSELAASAGSQFDERIVRAFLNVSLGRLRLVMGPLSWLAHAPALGRLPLTPAVSSLGGTLTAVAAAVSTGIVGAPEPPAAHAALREASPPARVAAEPTAPAARRQRPPSRRYAAAPAVRPPVAPQVIWSLDEDAPALVRLRGLHDPQRISTLRIVAPPHAGRARPRGTRSIAYLPPPNFHGSTTLGYEACWRRPRCAVGAVALTVQPVNDLPLTTADSAQTDEDKPVAIDVLANDSDVERSPLSLVSAWGATTGATELSAGRVSWNPPLDYHGEAAFLYAAADGDGGVTVDHVTVYVAPVNDAPQAVPDHVTTDEDVAVRVEPLANDHDPDGDRLSLVSVNAPTVGHVESDRSSLTFTPPRDYNGVVRVDYTAADPSGMQTDSWAQITVRPVNDAPLAVPDHAEVAAGRPVVVDVVANDADPEGDPLALAAVGVPSSGSAEVEAGRVRYVAGVAPGLATVEYTVTDDRGAAATGVLSISVRGVNAAPGFVAGADQVVLEDSAAQRVAGWASAITPGPPHEAGQSVTFAVTTGDPRLFAAGGQPAVLPDGTLTFTPAPNAYGASTISVHARDDGGTANGGIDASAPQTRTLTVLDVNDAPHALDDSVTVGEDEAGGITFDVLANDSDPESDTLAVASHDPSTISYGTLTRSADRFTFVPAAAFHGTQTFSYTVGDGRGGTDTGSVTITVEPRPDAPVAGDDAFTTATGVAVSRAAPGLLENDGDEDGETVTVLTAPVAPPSNGTLTLGADGSFTYTPAAGFVGADSFTYRIVDPTGRTDDGTVTITVASGSSTSLLYLGTSGPTQDVWSLTTTQQSAASPVPDHDGDGKPGLSILATGAGESESNGAKWHAWTTAALAAPLELNGPVVLRLWSSVSGFDPDDGAHPHVFLYDCIAGGINCLKIAQNHVHVRAWNGGTQSWVYREITVGSVTRTIAGGRELRVRLQTSQNDLWVALTAAHPSALAVTLP